MNSQIEELGQLIDTLENYVHTLLTPLPSEVHVECLREVLPDLLTDFKDLYDTFGLIAGERGE